MEGCQSPVKSDGWTKKKIKRTAALQQHWSKKLSKQAAVISFFSPLPDSNWNCPELIKTALDSVLMKTKEVATITFFAARGGSCLITLPYLSLSALFKLQHETYLVGDDWRSFSVKGWQQIATIPVTFKHFWLNIWVMNYIL